MKRLIVLGLAVSACTPNPLDPNTATEEPVMMAQADEPRPDPTLDPSDPMRPDEPTEPDQPNEPIDEPIKDPTSNHAPDQPGMDAGGQDPYDLNWYLYDRHGDRLPLQVIGGLDMNTLPRPGEPYERDECFAVTADGRGQLASLFYTLSSGEICVSRYTTPGIFYYTVPGCTGNPMIPYAGPVVRPGLSGQLPDTITVDDLVIAYGQPTPRDTTISVYMKSGESCIETNYPANLWIARTIPDDIRQRYTAGAPYELVWE